MLYKNNTSKIYKKERDLKGIEFTERMLTVHNYIRNLLGTNIEDVEKKVGKYVNLIKQLNIVYRVLRRRPSSSGPRLQRSRVFDR